MKIAFIVEFPTQFEVPFYQYLAKRFKVEALNRNDFDSAHPDKGIKESDFKEQKTTDLGLKSIDFHVIFNNTDEKDYHDFELGKKVGWGFNLYEGYKYFIADRNNIVNSVAVILDREKYDFIILNGYKNSYSGLTALCKRRKIPVALRIDSVLYNLSPIKKLLKRIYLPFAYRKFNHFFAVGSKTKQFLNWLGIGDEKISYFSYSIDEEWFRKKAHDVTKVKALKHRFNINNEKVLLSVAKFVPREAPWDILKAFEMLNDDNLVLVLVGDGEEREALKAYSKRVPHLKIIFTGYIPYQKLGYYYGISDVFIHAAKNEPWGVSVHEALSCSCVVITSDKVGSSHDLIVEGKSGFTYPFGNATKLAETIKLSFQIDKPEQKKTNEVILKQWSYEQMWEEIKNGANHD